MLYWGPRKLDDKQIRRILQKRNSTEFVFYRSVNLDEKAMKRKGPTKFFLKSQVSQIQKEHKMSIPIKKLVQMNIKCQIWILQESFELNKLCMTDLQSFWPPKLNCSLQTILFFNAICVQTKLISLTFVYFLTIAVLQNRLISF